MKIHVASPEKIKQITAQAIGEWLIAHEDHPVLLLSSGGSSLDIWNYVVLPGYGQNITWGVTDDRFSADPAVNNFMQLTHTKFYQSTVESGASGLSTEPEKDESLELFADRYDQLLHDWVENHPDGLIFATLGVGPDGHAIGVLPYPEDSQGFMARFFATSRWVVGYDVGAKSQYPRRITVTFHFLQQYLDCGLTYAVGSEKREVLEDVVSGDSREFAPRPARFLRDLPTLGLFTDQDLVDIAKELSVE